MTLVVMVNQGSKGILAPTPENRIFLSVSMIGMPSQPSNYSPSGENY